MPCDSNCPACLAIQTALEILPNSVWQCDFDAHTIETAQPNDVRDMLKAYFSIIWLPNHKYVEYWAYDNPKRLTLHYGYNEL